MLTATNLSKSFGSIKAVRNVSLQVKNGAAACIVGRSGCGKSTLLKIIGLLIRADKGEVMIDQISATRSDGSNLQKLRQAIGYSFQEPLLFPYLNALENITAIVIQTHKSPRFEISSEARKTLSRLGLSQRLTHRPSKLSVGEKKRVDLARALVKNPRLLIADEPFSNLDLETSGLVVELFREYVRDGGTLVYSSTDTRDSKFADLTYRMD
jgi:ABC-type lipoprotein export system ATPase subunit